MSSFWYPPLAVSWRVEFEVPGPPVAWHRPRFRGKQSFKEKVDRDFQALVRLAAFGAIDGSVWLKLGVFAVDIISGVPNLVRRDVDNLAKNVLDGLSDVLFTDDSQVVDIHLRKRLVSDPYTWVSVERIGEDLRAIS